MEYEGELDFSNFWVPNMANELPSSCTRANTCNPLTDPDALHTHTSLHMHTKTVTSAALPACETGEINSEMNKSKKNKRPLGNREAVRKYREKKKAWAASLQDEVVRLRIWNKQLLTMHLESKAAFEAEIERLKCLLAEIHGRIEVGIGSFGSQNFANLPNMAGEYVQYNDPAEAEGTGGGDGAGSTSYNQGFGCCGIENLPCLLNSSSVFMEFNGCGRCGLIGNVASTVQKQPNIAPLEF